MLTAVIVELTYIKVMEDIAYWGLFMEKTELKVKGMSCGHCKIAVEKALMGIEGVETASVDLDEGKANVSYDPSKASTESMKKTIVDAGYEA